MNDTSPEVAQRMMEMFRRKAPAERLAMGCSMFDFSKQLVIHSLLEEEPRLSPQELRERLFLRFYGNDFNGEQREKILRFITAKSGG